MQTGGILTLFSYTNKRSHRVETFTSVVLLSGLGFYAEGPLCLYFQWEHFKLWLILLSGFSVWRSRSYRTRLRSLPGTKSLTKTALLFIVQMLTSLKWKHSPPSMHRVSNTSALINDLFDTCHQTIKWITIKIIVVDSGSLWFFFLRILIFSFCLTDTEVFI